MRVGVVGADGLDADDDVVDTHVSKWISVCCIMCVALTRKWERDREKITTKSVTFFL